MKLYVCPFCQNELSNTDDPVCCGEHGHIEEIEVCDECGDLIEECICSTCHQIKVFERNQKIMELSCQI